MYELWVNKELPEPYQKAADGFATTRDTIYEEQIFRAGLYCGMNYKEICEHREKDAGL